jgi:hypothetical protein
MEKTTEKLPALLVEKLKELQKKGNESVNTLGKLGVDIHLYTTELERLQKIKAETLENYVKNVNEINAELKFLEEKYPNGEINLDEGVVIY